MSQLHEECAAAFMMHGLSPFINTVRERQRKEPVEEERIRAQDANMKCVTVDPIAYLFREPRKHTVSHCIMYY